MRRDELIDDRFERARFPIQIELPAAPSTSLADAQLAIKREYRDSVKWKLLRCRKVSILSQSDSGTIYILHVGHSVEFDWTWEGALAFRPTHIDGERKDGPSLFDQDATDAHQESDSILWTGEVLEVDEATGRIFVSVSNPEFPPTKGSFYVRPFEFLAFLNTIFNEQAYETIRQQLPNRLFATEGGIHPDVKNPKNFGLQHMQMWWGKAWSVLWGPPGTGKTYTTGKQVAEVLADTSERILVVSTTNRATDAVTISIGSAARALKLSELDRGTLLRIGKGARLERYQNEKLVSMLKGTETEYLGQIELLSTELTRSRGPEEKAIIRSQIKSLQREMRDASIRNFLDSKIRVVVTTAFKATTMLKRAEVKSDIETGYAPFTTIMIDEAGLLSRASISALSMLASRRVVLIGDSQQLAPISRISRVLPTSQMKWLAMSGLSHLDTVTTKVDGVHVLREQRRMQDDICKIVSKYKYDSQLVTAPEVGQRQFKLPHPLSIDTRAVWYVLDEEALDMPNIRAERGPGNRSWIRKVSIDVLDHFFSHVEFRESHGLFLSPFKAQASLVSGYFAENHIQNWTASTVHSQQGSEADIVIFDTVNAGSYSWPYDEWQRMINVAISRARESFILFASRGEMNEPYLRPLIRQLKPRVLRKHFRHYAWVEVPVTDEYVPPQPSLVKETTSVGYQITKRQELRPVLSHEQQRLCGLELDGKPRLVRGVAGSGKTVVLAHWLMQTVNRLKTEQNIRVWAIFANRSLQTLISESIVTAWEQETDGTPFPWHRVSLQHIRDLLQVVLPEVGLDAQNFGFDYDLAAQAYLARVDIKSIEHRCDALFIDEAQDMGPNTLKLLTSLTRQTNLYDSNSRSVNIFYDNAQNIYDRAIPKWTDLGLDMRGRSSVMKESFRSTKPITEFALNVLCQLQPQTDNQDYKELLARGLVEQVVKNGMNWWNVRFNQIDGPKPEFRKFESLDKEFVAIAEYCRQLVQDEGVKPSDITIIYNSRFIRARLEEIVAPVLKDLGVVLSVQTNQAYQRNANAILATTSASFKGYDSEVVIIPGIDFFRAQDKGVLASSLYVAMTRARSILTLFAHRNSNPNAKRIFKAVEDCLDCLEARPAIDAEISPQDDLEDVLLWIGEENRRWLERIWLEKEVSQEPIFAENGELIAEPLFWFREHGVIHACFGREVLSTRALQKVEDYGVKILNVRQAQR
ncbi:MAG: AAA domain-containing protein [Pirellula sp.]|jgi:superfamily I DNA/RNA helicase